MDWLNIDKLEALILPPCIHAIKGQKLAQIGIAVIQANDTALATETCMEVWYLDSTHVRFYTDGVEIIGNASGSHH